MAQVQAARKFSILHPILYHNYKKGYKNFKRRISAGSPSFGVLWHFADFIKYAELIFFFDNKKDNWLYSSTDYTPTQNGFRINRAEYDIVIKLYSETKRVGIDIIRKTGNKTKANYTFENEQWTEEPDEYDLILIDRIIDIINGVMLNFLEWTISTKLGISDD